MIPFSLYVSITHTKSTLYKLALNKSHGSSFGLGHICTKILLEINDILTAYDIGASLQQHFLKSSMARETEIK